MEKLTEQLESFIDRLSSSNDFRTELNELYSIYPFSRYEYIIATLLSKNVIQYEEYTQLREDYINRNLFLCVFEITSPRGFGDTWALGHLLEVEPSLKRPSKKIDVNYRGEYDLFLEVKNSKEYHYIKVEVKASRATDRERNDEPLCVKALSSESKRPFLMNFQQLKPSCCDVFLWIAVYRNAIKYWVINSKKVKNNPNFTPQHRNRETDLRTMDFAKNEIFEGQIMMTESNINDFDQFLASGRTLRDKIISQHRMR
ncbi:MAG: hypothetical protein ACRCUY_02970 [Thermoguttaceae bacterium]